MSCFFLAYKQDRWRLTLKLNSFLAMPFNVRLNRELKYNPALTSQIKWVVAIFTARITLIYRIGCSQAGRTPQAL
jgi:hypothetical protein